jgi:hypothetical protein
MKAYSITYDLKAPGRDYEKLYEAIKASGKWSHYLESTWLVVSNETSQQLWNRLAPTIDKNDFVLIIEVRRNSFGWLPKDAWEWINTNVPF